MTELEAWLVQVESDFTAARRVLREDDPGTYCQTIAKYQQIVEKSINVIDAALRERGLFPDRAQSEHYPIRMMNRLVRIPVKSHGEIAARLQRLFKRLWADIHDLCVLAPKLPPRGELYRPNTEYPFQSSNGEWTAPAASSSFSWRQVQRFENVARSLRAEAQRIADGARLGIL